jgi:hypothetical protein
MPPRRSMELYYIIYNIAQNYTTLVTSYMLMHLSIHAVDLQLTMKADNNMLN